MNISLIQGDITVVEVHAIVNAANSGLLGGGGVDGAIHRVGGPSILAECRAIRMQQGGCPAGSSVITTAGNLPAQKVIHTVGPVWGGGHEQEEALLRSCYLRSMELAETHDLRSIAFPNISTGVYGYPKDLACRVALETVRTYSPRVLQDLIFVCFDEENFQLYKELL